MGFSARHAGNLRSLTAALSDSASKSGRLSVAPYVAGRHTLRTAASRQPKSLCAAVKRHRAVLAPPFPPLLSSPFNQTCGVMTTKTRFARRRKKQLDSRAQTVGKRWLMESSCWLHPSSSTTKPDPPSWLSRVNLRSSAGRRFAMNYQPVCTTKHTPRSVWAVHDSQPIGVPAQHAAPGRVRRSPTRPESAPPTHCWLTRPPEPRAITNNQSCRYLTQEERKQLPKATLRT